MLDRIIRLGALLGLIAAPAAAHAACIPLNSPLGSIGCQPPAVAPSMSDYFEAWQPGLFPGSARLMSFGQLGTLFLPLGGGTLAGPLTGTALGINQMTFNAPPGGWSSYNIGKGLIVSGHGVNPAIGFLDNAGNNPFAIFDSGAAGLSVAAMPPLSDSSTPPTIIEQWAPAGITINVPLGITQLGTSGALSSALSMTKTEPSAPSGTAPIGVITDNINFADGNPFLAYAGLQVIANVNGSGGNGPASNVYPLTSSLNENSLRSLVSPPNESQDTNITSTVTKTIPTGGIPPGRRMRDAWNWWSQYSGANLPTSQGGADIVWEHDVSLNGLDDAGGRQSEETIFGLNKTLASGGYPASVNVGRYLSSNDLDLWFHDNTQLSGNFNHAALDLFYSTAGVSTITSATPGSPTHVVTVDNIMPLESGGEAGGGVDFAPASTAVQLKATTAASSGTALTLADTNYLDVGEFVSDTTTWGAGSGAVITSLSGNTITLNRPMTVGSGDTILFAHAAKNVTINGDRYLVTGVALSGPGTHAGTVYFLNPITVADATTGALIYPNAHSIWTCPGSATAPWCDIAFNVAGTDTIRDDGAGGLAATGKALTLATPQSSAPAAPATGGSFYVDASNVLHYKNGAYDFPLAGACFNGSCGPNPNWWIGNYAVGEPNASATDYATFRVQKNVTGSGGFGPGGFGSALVVSDGVSGPGIFKVALNTNAASGATTIITTDNAGILYTGQPLAAPGLALGTTISSVAHNAPSAGLATITLSTPTTAPMFTYGGAGPVSVAVGASAATEAENTITSTCDTWQPNNGTPINSCVAGFFVANKWVAGNTAPFGLDVVSNDQTGLSSAHGGAGIIDAEMDAAAAGPDNATYFGNGVQTSATGIRKSLQMVSINTGPSGDGPGVIEDGALATLGAAVNGNEQTTVVNAYRAMGIVGWGNYLNAFTADGSGLGEVGLNLAPGYVVFSPSAPAASGANTVTFPHISVTVGQLVSDASGCIPARATITAVTEGQSVSNTVITLSAPTTCTIALSDAVTFTNKFSDGWLATGTYTDAFANLTNTGATGLIKLGSTLNSGTVGKLSFMGQDSTAATVDYGDITGSVVSNAHGATVGALDMPVLAMGGTTPRSLSARFADTVNVKDYGADPTGVADSAPAFRAAIASNRMVFVPPGTYNFASTQTSPCCAFNPAAVLVQSLTNFKIDGYGATIVVDPRIALSSAFQFDKDTNFSIRGLTIQGSRTGLTSGQENVGISFSSDVSFRVSDIHFTNSFGGNGAAIAGDWMVNGVFDHLQIDGAAHCADVAFLLHVSFDTINALGTDTNGNSGSGQVGQTCFSVLNDTVNAAQNNTGIAFTETDDVSVTGLQESNFVTGAWLATGTHYVLSGNRWHHNPGIGGAEGLGVWIDYNTTAGFSSVGVPPSDIIINGDRIDDNGFVVAGAGVQISSSTISNSDQIADVTVENSLIENNSAQGINSDAASHLSNIMLAGDVFSGAAQTTRVGATLNGVASGVQLPQTTVASLPTCNAAEKGVLYGVTDATAPAYNGALTGGGAVAIPAFCNGSAWTAH